MIETLHESYYQLLACTPTTHQRYLYPSFETEERLVGLIGARGVGKTTLMLQYIKQHYNPDSEAFYFSADHLLFKQRSLLEVVRELWQQREYTSFFIDESHKYANWNQELKNLHDGFPKISIVFSGSSSLSLTHGRFDLSRRGMVFKLEGLSFREFLKFRGVVELPALTWNELLHKAPGIARDWLNLPRLRGHFEDYLKYGYYAFGLENSKHYAQKLLNVIDKTIYEDIATFYNLKSQNLGLFKKILVFLATTPPGTINSHNLAKALGIDPKTT